MAKFYIDEFGDAIVNKLKNNVVQMAITGLVPTNIEWSRAIQSLESKYILNPFVDLPKIKVRFNNVNTALGPFIGNHTMTCVYEFSIYYYRRQVPGQAHQYLMVNDLEKIAEVFSADPNIWRPNEFNIVDPDQQQLQSIYPAKIMMFPELHHSIDDPSIRISVGEINIIVNSFSFDKPAP